MSAMNILELLFVRIESYSPDLETSWAPVYELDGPLGLDGRDGSIHVLRDDVTTVQHAASHVLAVAWVTLHHLVGRLEAGCGDLGHRQLLMIGLGKRANETLQILSESVP